MRQTLDSYPVDIDPAQVVRWVKAEQEAWPSGFRITAVRSRELREIPARNEFHLGDEERDDLSEVAVLAAVDIAPGNAADGWVLHIVVEDEIGPRLSKADARADLLPAEVGAGGLSSGAAVDAPDSDAMAEGDGAAGGTEQRFDLGAFQREFMRPGRGIATITAEVDGAPARRRLANLLEAIEKNGPHAGRPAATAADARGAAAGPRRGAAGSEAPAAVMPRG